MKKREAAAEAVTERSPSRYVLEAEPQPLEIDLRHTAVVVVDMQNAFVAKGAYVDLSGRDISTGRGAIKPIQRLCAAARSRGCKVIYIYTVHYPGDAGTGPESVFWHKEGSLIMYREHPEYRDKLLLPDTWGIDIVPELTPEKDDILVQKPRYSGFFETNLDTVLKRYSMRYLLMTGVATNVCVEATTRDAYYRGYFPILVSDGAATAAPSFVHEATLVTIKRAYGWVTTSDHVLKLMR